MGTTGLMGALYLATFIDKGTGLMAIALLTQKSQGSTRYIEYSAKGEKERDKKI